MTDKHLENSQNDNHLPLLTIASAILGFIPLSLVGYLILVARRDQAQLVVIMNFLWVIGGVISAWVLYLQISFMQKPISALNKSAGNIKRDVLHSLLLAVILNAGALGFQAISSRFSGFDAFFDMIAQDPARLVVFMTAGLFLWALYEELTRAFTLNRLWELVKSERMKQVVIIVNALVFALAYAYQGWGAMAAAGAAGIILGVYYQRKGRIIPLILAHFLLNLVIFTFRIYFS